MAPGKACKDCYEDLRNTDVNPSTGEGVKPKGK